MDVNNSCLSHATCDVSNSSYILVILLFCDVLHSYYLSVLGVECTLYVTTNLYFFSGYVK